MNTTSVSEKYVVYFKREGFYAEKQPHYEWSFTDDLDKAKKYQSVKGATQLCERTSKFKGVIYKIALNIELNLEPVPAVDTRSKAIKDNTLKSEFIEELLKDV